MKSKNVIRINEAQLKQMISESVKKVLKESMKSVDIMNTVTPNVAKKYGFQREYSGFEGGLELWSGYLPQSIEEKQTLLRNLGIKKFTSENYLNNKCTITVDPSGKSVIVNNKKPLSKQEFAQLVQGIKTMRITAENAVKILVARGYNQVQSEQWVEKFNTNI